MKPKKCPVCDWEIKEAVNVQVGEREIVVCCDDCAKKAKEDPTNYAGPARQLNVSIPVEPRPVAPVAGSDF